MPNGALPSQRSATSDTFFGRLAGTRTEHHELARVPRGLHVLVLGGSRLAMSVGGGSYCQRMLRRLDLKSPWRSLDRGFWPNDLPLGKRTVIYGHNGSGKSTLAELLLSLSEGQAATGVVWEQNDERKVTVSVGGSSPSSLAVFTRAWVEANLSEFLAGENADAIVTLGQAAIDSKEKEEELEREIERLRDEADRMGELRRKSQQKVDKLVREVQERIVDELQRFDYGHYSRNRYSVIKVGEMLRAASGKFPDDGAHADALVRLGEGAPSTVPDVASPPTTLDGLRQLGSILSRTPTRVAIAALEVSRVAQEWVEQGLLLHEQRQNCLFCDGTLSMERREQLARHFDESWLQIRSEAQQLLAKVGEQRRTLIAWLESLPDHSALSSDLQAVYKQAAEETRSEVDARVACLELVENALKAKAADPSATPDEPECEVLGIAVSATVISEAVMDHNEQEQRHEELTTHWKAVVLDHIIGSQSRTFRDLETQAAEAKEANADAVRAAELAERAIERVRQEQFTTKEMADTLTRDLARVYGKEHLNIAVTGDGTMPLL